MDETVDDAGQPPLPASGDQPWLTPSHLSFPVIGIGASAGGLGALLKFLEHMPAGNGMAFVVVVHLSPRHVSNLPALLQSATRMTVTQVTTAMPDSIPPRPPRRERPERVAEVTRCG